MGPGKESRPCPLCGEALVQIGATMRCPGCSFGAPADTEVIELPSERTAHAETIGRALAERDVLVRHEGAAVLAVAGRLMPLNERTAGTLRVLARVAETRRERDGGLRIETRLPSADEARLVANWATVNVDRLRECRIAVPRSVLWIGADGRARATPAGLHDGILTGEAVEPRATGAWSEFLAMTPFATEADRRTYEAWCLTSVLPTQVGMYPLLVVTANGRRAGKTWAVRCLAWALGYPAGHPITIEDENRQHALRRELFAGLLDGRVIEVDNVSGSDTTYFASRALSEILTDDVISQTAMYRYGVDRVRNYGLIALTMNSGRVDEDLADRAVGVELDFDPDDPRIARRSALGEDYWRRPETSRAVLAEILQTAIERWDATLGWTLPEPVRRPESWHRLAWRLTGARVPELKREARGAGLYDTAILAALLQKPLLTHELGERLRATPGPLAGVAGRGPAALGRELMAIAALEPRLRRRLTKRGAEWSWAE